MRIPASNFSLAHTIESGQLFRYERKPEGYLLAHRDKAFLVSQQGDELLVHAATPNVSKEWLSWFFALDATPPAAVDEYSAQALAFCGGMRICRQDPWECLIGFLCSQNNNIVRIRALMSGIARNFGKPLRVGKYTVYAFPEPGDLRAGRALDEIRAGYRAKYLLGANSINESWLRSLGSLSHEDARAALQSIHGVGPKVADCILLFAYGHRNAFPVDTWVAQIMQEQYGVHKRVHMQRKAVELFGSDAGILQQYLFHYKRSMQ